jgi:flagellar basal-body rod protein FlgC
MFKVFSVIASGMKAQRVRMNVIASNLANAHTTGGVSGATYRRRDVVFTEARPEAGFSTVLDSATKSGLEGVRVSAIVEDKRPLKTVYEPGHPGADSNGYVQYPNVNVAEEMVNMISASRSYEANVSAFRATREMMMRAMDIIQ